MDYFHFLQCKGSQYREAGFGFWFCDTSFSWHTMSRLHISRIDWKIAHMAPKLVFYLLIYIYFRRHLISLLCVVVHERWRCADKEDYFPVACGPVWAIAHIDCINTFLFKLFSNILYIYIYQCSSKHENLWVNARPPAEKFFSSASAVRVVLKVSHLHIRVSEEDWRGPSDISIRTGLRLNPTWDKRLKRL